MLFIIIFSNVSQYNKRQLCLSIFTQIIEMKIWDQFKSKSLTKQIFLMVSVVFIVFFLVYNSLMIYTKHNRYIEVPNLSGLNLDDAIDVLKKNRLKYEVLDSSKFFVEIPNYSIISQIPLEKELVKKNRKIYLNVNPRNFQKVSLPNVIQITKRNAESILTALGFQVLEYNYVDDIGKDMVLDVLYEGEKILPGQKIPMNSGLSLILGNGKR